MAIYEYECPIFGKRKTLTRPMSESDAPGPYCFDPETKVGAYSRAHRLLKMVRIVSRFTAIVKNGTRA